VKILVAGGSGQVGRELCRQGLARGCEVVAPDRAIFNIGDAGTVQTFVANCAPDIIFNAAAWTNVDEAESQLEQVFRVNRDGAVNLAAACAEHSIPLVHYSTDYIFDGAKASAYVEDDVPAPINAYGRSKLAGEEAVRTRHEQHLILRTSWIFSAHGSNFVKTMLKLGATHTELRVVADQVGKPTSAATIAQISLAIASDVRSAWGTYHLAQPDAVSWHDFATAIFDAAAQYGQTLAVESIVPISSDDYSVVARRPENSVLDCHKLEDQFEVVIQDWHEALDTVIGDLLGDGISA
jgi:dTDP-4-dehydrorhamnose reductase